MRELHLRKFILVLLAVTAASSARNIQVNPSFQLGLNMANIRGDVSEQYKQVSLKPGLSGGVGVDFCIKKKISIEPELLYSPKGHKWVVDNLVFVNTLSYLEMPILFKMNVPGYRTVPSVYAGPSFGLLLSSKVTEEDKNESNNDENNNVDNENQTSIKKDTSEVANQWQKYDFGVALGMALYVPVNYGSIFVDLRYTFGFSDINKNAYASYEKEKSTNKYDIKNGAFSLMLGYEFGKR